MDDVAIRAITIGASVFIALITISAVLTYYTTAKDMVRQVGSGTDIAGLYEKSIEEILLKKIITGTEFKNLLNYFYGREDIHMNIADIDEDRNGIKVLYNREQPAGNNIGEIWHYSGEDLTFAADNMFFENPPWIVPNAKYSLSTEMVDGILTIKIENYIK